MLHPLLRASALLVPVLLISNLTQATETTYPIQDTPLTGGDGSVKQHDQNAYSLPLANMSMTKRLDFSVGNSFFRNPWVVAPASTDARDGLGPLFNTNSCQGCHLKDGRGHAPASIDTPSVSLFLRLSVPADPEQDADLLREHGLKPAPIYGGQLQTSAIPGMKPEADMIVEWQSVTQTLGDGTKVVMRKPVYHIENPNYGPLPNDLLTSPRVAPQMIGLGLVEAIPEAALLANEDPDDANGDGISGRANRVWDRVAKQTVVGRFGWKAGQPSIMQQSMDAFAGDMGLTSTVTPATDCTPQQQCDRFPNGGDIEVTDNVANFINFYATSLAVPTRREQDNPQVQRGASVFNDIGCAACHTPRYTTGQVERPELSGQVIWPYSDFLLHDMGPGLADGRPEFLADGNEWRTPPLWGLGLTKVVNPQAGFLHDGRAETVEHAILWHDGEARPAADQYRMLPQAERDALLRFLNSL
ncbi:di-heme oxidoreductase family protein [Halopseudomonas oceani]|uniref:Thiol oxidoreductase n=1 Tax=Halopseudomonas oceani TaxID=1708783 RepID=A0A2P4ERB1_9GAMM|nr:di-heme oxidoredictase family protein [Halopseudomonas oceani]POB01158.1 thiol oxidoreductase [Halopseudomonas oceani]